MPKCVASGELETPGVAVTMYEKCGLRVRAAEEAVRLKDAEGFARVLEAAGGSGTAEAREIERLGAGVFKK